MKEMVWRMTVRPERIESDDPSVQRVWMPNESALTGRIEDVDDIDKELDMAPDPVWPGMTRRNFKRIGNAVRDYADLLGLRDWFLSLMWEPSEHTDADASIVCTYGRKHAQVYLSRDFPWFDLQRQKHVIIHELLHCHFDTLESQLRNVLPDILGMPTWSVIEGMTHERIEHTTDNMAEILAKYLPDMPALEES